MKYILTSAVVVLSLSLLPSSHAKDFTGEQGEAILNELKQIRSLLENLQRKGTSLDRNRRNEGESILVRNISFDLREDSVEGDESAKVTLIEFSDYQCPFCARHFSKTLPKLRANYLRPGKIKYVFRDFPITAIHKEAFHLAEFARCAAEQGKFWEIHDKIFSEQGKLEINALYEEAENLGLKETDIKECVESGRQSSKVRKDVAEGQKAGISGTPTFFLGLTEVKSQKFKAMTIIRGAQPYKKFEEAIEKLLVALEKSETEELKK